MKRILFMLLAVFTLVSCGVKKEKKEDSSVKNIEVVTELSVDEIYQKGEKFADKTIVVTGTIGHVCKHGGKRCFLMGNNEDNSLRVETADAMKPFSLDQIGNEMKISGVLKEIRIDEKYLKEWEEEARADNQDDEKRHLDGHEKGDGEHSHDSSELDGVLEQIELYRKEMKTNGKGYVSRFFMEGKKVVN